MGKRLLAFSAIALAIGVGVSAARPAEATNDEPAGATKLPDGWSVHVTAKDLMDEIAESATRMGQNLKKGTDFDKFLKSVNTEGHLMAILAALVQEHPDASKLQGVAAEIQEQALTVAKAAEAKGGRNFRDAQAAHKKLSDVLRKGAASDRAANRNSHEPPHWTSLGALSDVMKRVEPSYKYIRGKMSSETAFRKDSETIRHNAAMLHVFSQIAPAFRPAESDMVKLSASMSAASADMLEAVKSGDFDKASDANTAINNSCNECHKAKRFQKKGSDFDF